MFKGNMGGGFGGGNMQNMLRQAQKLQEDMQNKLKQADETLKNTTLTSSVSGGLVKVNISGDKKILSVKIDPKIVDNSDVEMLEDLLVAGVNEAINLANEKEKELKQGLNDLGGLI